jgi:mRNA-degrading endonuclease RelE of RelBE toxin-antitoxin system
VEALVIQLQQGELPGDKIPNVGYNVYKARLRNRSAGRGKRSGFRVIYYVQRVDFVGMITIYFKSEQQDVTTPARKHGGFYGSRTSPPRWTLVRVQGYSKQRLNRGQFSDRSGDHREHARSSL